MYKKVVLAAFCFLAIPFGVWSIAMEKSNIEQRQNPIEACQSAARAMRGAVGDIWKGLIRLDSVRCDGATLVVLYTNIGDKPADPKLTTEADSLIPKDLKDKIDNLDSSIQKGIKKSMHRLHSRVYCSQLAHKGVNAVWIYRNEVGSPTISISMNPRDCATK